MYTIFPVNISVGAVGQTVKHCSLHILRLIYRIFKSPASTHTPPTFCMAYNFSFSVTTTVSFCFDWFIIMRPYKHFGTFLFSVFITNYFMLKTENQSGTRQYICFFIYLHACMHYKQSVTKHLIFNLGSVVDIFQINMYSPHSPFHLLLLLTSWPPVSWWPGALQKTSRPNLCWPAGNHPCSSTAQCPNKETGSWL